MFEVEKDKLIQFGNTKISYDNDALNPTKIGNNIYLSYEGRNLIFYQDVEKNIYNKYYYINNNCRARKEILNNSGEVIDTIY